MFILLLRYNKIRARSGFSLIEMMIVISITLVLSGALVFYNRSTEEQLSLFREKAMVLGILGRAKSLAIKKLNDASLLTCAFGVHFDFSTKKIVLFKDKGTPNGSQIFGCRYSDAPHEYVNNFQYDENSGEKMEEYTINDRVLLSFVSSNKTQQQVFDVVFVPPDPFATSTGIQLPMALKLSTQNGNYQNIIRVSGAGQITSE